MGVIGTGLLSLYHVPCILVRTKGSQECGQILEEPRYTYIQKVPLTTPPRIRLRARILLARKKGMFKG